MIALLEDFHQTEAMETGGESFTPTPQERIRQAALGLLLDAEHGVGGFGPNGPSGRLSSFVITHETDLAQEGPALSLAEIHNTEDGLKVEVSEFKKELNFPEDDYELISYAFIDYSDPFDSERDVSIRSSADDLNRVAKVLEDDGIEELENSGVSTRVFLRLKLQTLERSIDDRLVRLEDLASKISANERSFKVGRFVTKLKRILRF